MTMAVTLRCERAERIYGISGNGKTLSGLPSLRPKKPRLIATNPPEGENAGSGQIAPFQAGSVPAWIERVVAWKGLPAVPRRVSRNGDGRPENIFAHSAFALIRGIRVNSSAFVLLSIKVFSA